MFDQDPEQYRDQLISLLTPFTKLASPAAVEHLAQSLFPKPENYQQAYPAVVEHMAQTLYPRSDDYELAFREDSVQAARDYYTEVFSKRAIPLPKRGQTELEVFLATTEMLEVGYGDAAEFPAGYRRITGRLAPSRVWALWRFTAVGTSVGMRYDGLVWLDDHWAWFPKPWLALPPPTVH
jgi:hypothetical protein